MPSEILDVWLWLNNRAQGVESMLLQGLPRPNTTGEIEARDTSVLHLISFRSDSRLDLSIA